MARTPGSLMLPRRLVAAGGLAALAARASPLRAAELLLTPAQTEGPFYPVRLPDDRDSDLVRVKGADAQAIGRVTHVMGRVLDRAGRPVPHALVEIWQCDARGRYRHPRETGSPPRDPGFQGYGRSLSDSGGGYRFRTIKPVPYPGRTPHIHFKISLAGRGELLTTQMYVAGEPLNERDFLYRSLDADERGRVTVDLRPAAGMESGALAGMFDIVLAA